MMHHVAWGFFPVFPVPKVEEGPHPALVTTPFLRHNVPEGPAEKRAKP